MSCFHPLSAFVDGAGGQPRIGNYWSGEQGHKLELPCGRCVGCRMDRARAWSIRCMHEAQLYDSNLFLTLDYAPEHLPSSLSLEYPHFQGFLKRLRKAFRGVSPGPSGSYPIRFFVAGEYGETYGRPHYHAILFNFHFPDAQRWANGTSRSSRAESLWGRGNVVIGDVTPESAAYVAGYTLSKVYGPAAEDHYEDVLNVQTGELTRRRPEFCNMSRRPGVGAWWFEKYGRDLFPRDKAVMQGREFKVPRYYFERFKAHGDQQIAEAITHERYLKAREKPIEESTDRRRSEREEIARSKLATFSSRRH